MKSNPEVEAANRAIASTLEHHRQTEGMSYNQVRDAVRDLIGSYCPTQETLRTFHQVDRVSRATPLDLVVVCALAKVYGVSFKDSDPEVAAALARARDLLIDASSKSRAPRRLSPSGVLPRRNFGVTAL